MENKELMVVMLFENKQPVEIVGVFDTMELAIEAMIKDADRLIEDAKQFEGLEYFRGDPDEATIPMLVVAEDPQFSKNYQGDTIWEYNIFTGNLNNRFDDAFLDGFLAI